MTKEEKSEKIKKYALELGFDAVGIIKSEFLSHEESKLRNWLKKDFHAGMDYMMRNTEKRLDPSLLVEKAKTLIVVLKNYFPAKRQIQGTLKVSKYAYSQDYHKILKEDLFNLFAYINENIEHINGRVFVDSAPVLEKKWAQKAGLGWIGKNSLLLTKKGSFFFIGEIIIDIELDYEKTEFKNFCGTCTKCIDACPTNAITEPFVINSNLCISYLTIERRGIFDENMNLNFRDYIFGCDICQDVCPWNRKSKPSEDKRFSPHFLLLELQRNDWKNINKQKFDNIFRKSAVKRTKYEGLMRNINYVIKQSES